MKKGFLLICISLLVPLSLLLIVLFAPEAISHPAAKFLIFPIEWLVQDKETLRELTSVMFGRMTPNFVPIAMLLSFIFWFLLTLLVLIVFLFLEKKQAS